MPTFSGQPQPVRALLSMIAARHQPTYRHMCQVSAYTVMLADKLLLSCDQVETAGLAALLHDIGKVSVPDEVLVQPGPLCDRELQLMTDHAAVGADILARTGGLDEIVPAVRYHHEWFDGRGYPTGLAGLAIPLAARMIAVADAFDTMITPRPYRQALPVDLALRELERCAGTQFDPEITAAFVATVREAANHGAAWAQRRPYRASQIQNNVEPLALRLIR